MLEGKEFHFAEEKRALRRKTLSGRRRELIEASWNKLSVASTRLGLYGIIDEIAKTNNGLIVVENKWMKAPKKPHSGHIYQTAAYAMLAEEILGKPVRKIMIKYARDNKFFEIPVTDEIRKHVQWTVTRIKSIIENEKMPKVKATRKCRSCGFNKICRYT